MWDILYRPRRYADVLGQDASVRLLKTRISKATAFDTSYIFAGGYGRGKTTLGRIHAMAMLCQDVNQADPEPCGQCDSCKGILNEQSEAFTERDAASRGSTENMRALVDAIPYVLSNAPKRIYLIDECQRMPHAAQDVLLKPTEEKKMVLMLCTTEPDKIHGAIRSRCEEYTIKKVMRDDALPRMRMILNEQGVAFDDDAVRVVIDRADGHVRNVINNLEMIAQLGPITLANVREYLNLSVVTLYYQILLRLDEPLAAIELVGEACESTPPDEVAAGLAEAAMNCYRMARGWYCDLAYVDKSLAERVYEKHRDSVVTYARWLSAQRNVTRVSLEVDLLALCQKGLFLEAQVPSVVPPSRPSLLPPPPPPPPPPQQPVVNTAVQVPAVVVPVESAARPVGSAARPVESAARPVVPSKPVESPEAWVVLEPPTRMEADAGSRIMPRQRSTEVEEPEHPASRDGKIMHVQRWVQLFEECYQKRVGDGPK